MLRLTVGERPSWVEVIQQVDGRVVYSGLIEPNAERRVAVVPPGERKQVSVEHPTGEFSVALASREAPGVPGGRVVTESALLRTARLIMRGEVRIPHRIWPGA